MSTDLFNQIAQWLKYKPRTKLVLLEKKHQSIPYVDMGYELAAAIQYDIGKSILPMVAEQAVRKILNSNKHFDNLIGEYIAIDNWGILMEPELKLNLNGLLSGISQNSTVILHINESIKDLAFKNLHLDNIEHNQPK